jgi:hypothetical protein
MLRSTDADAMARAAAADLTEHCLEGWIHLYDDDSLRMGRSRLLDEDEIYENDVHCVITI